MAEIELEQAEVAFPIYDSKSRGLINSLFGYGRKEKKDILKLMAGKDSVGALRGISLTLASGDNLGIIGRNGAGKTTLLRLMSGIYEPTAGTVRVEGAVSSLTDMMLGMDADATGYENIRMRAAYLRLAPKLLDTLIPEIEEFTELGEFLNLPVRAYSTGMLLKLAFAISTCVQPEILIMDEMIGAGDAAFLSKAQGRIEDMLAATKILVIASHDPNIIRSFCNKALWLDMGRIKEIGDVESVLESYYASLPT